MYTHTHTHTHISPAIGTELTAALEVVRAPAKKDRGGIERQLLATKRV